MGEVEGLRRGALGRDLDNGLSFCESLGLRIGFDGLQI